MPREIKLKDTVKLVETSKADMYGDRNVVILSEVKALFISGSGYIREANSESETTSAHVYLDKHHPEIKGRGYKGIEGMYIIANPFNVEGADSWYRIENVDVGQRKLLANDVNNVHAFLKKIAPLETQNGV